MQNRQRECCVMNAKTTDVSVLSRAIVFAMGLGVCGGPAYAQQPLGPVPPGETAPGGISRPGEYRPPLPQPGAPPEAPLQTPPTAPSPAEKKAPYGVRVFVKEIRLTGNTVFTTEELKKITAPYEDHIVASSELEDLRVALTRYYIDHGYINSGAVIPDQKVVDGVIHMVIVEGRLSDIEVSGNTHLNSSYIKDRLRLGAGPPLNVKDLQEQIQIMLESPVIETMNSQLRPGDKPGEANLTTHVKEGPRVQFIPVIDNRLSPPLGSFRVLPQIYAYDLTGYGDVLSTNIGFAKGLTDANANWAVPLNAHDTSLTLLAEHTDSQVENGPFQDLDIKNKTQTLGFRVTQPFYRTPSQNFSTSLGMDLRKSQSELLGEDFAFTPGVPSNGEVKASIIRFSQDWTKRGAKQVLAARSQFSLGIDAFDATTNSDNLPSGKFFAWLGQFQWARRLGEDWGELIFRTDVQLTKDSLFTMEQFSVGGALSVRGYREYQIVRDYGFDSSLEYRYPLIKDPSGRSILALAPFVDCGGAKNNDLPDGPNPTFLYSAGAGLRWDPIPRVHAQVYWGHGFRSTDNDTHTLQDKGVHFLLSANLYQWP
jgi:hemolysin activation/secretion protein